MRILLRVSLKTAEADVILYPTELVHKFTAAHLAPFYLREHSKRILRGALYNDSKFLSDINVMDYSLVVGVDSQKNELVVGIVGKQRPLEASHQSNIHQITSARTPWTRNWRLGLKSPHSLVAWAEASPQ